MSKTYTDKIGERKNPRISINKLGEYISADATRRAAIIRDQKKPKDSIIIRYKDGRESIVKYFLNSMDENILVTGIDKLLSIDEFKLDTDFKKNDRDMSVELLNAFLKLKESLTFNGLTNIIFEKYKNSEVLHYFGLDISIYPDLIIRAKNKKNQDVIGAIKLSTSKTTPLNKDNLDVVTTGIYLFLDSKIKKNNELVVKQICFAIDIFSHTIQVTPNSIKRIQNNIYHSCVEIVSCWNAS